MAEDQRREYGLLMGDEQPMVSQTAVAAREAQTEAVGVVAVEEEEEEEIDDSKPLDASTVIPPPPPLPRVVEVEPDEAFAEAPAEEEVEEGAQGYELEEEDEETYEEDKPAFEEDAEEAPFVENPTEDEF
jgi:hypothetical protein